MKFLYKYRRLIGTVLAFTVSVMLLVSSIPASAAVTGYLRFSTLEANGGTFNAGNSTSVGIGFGTSGVNAKCYFTYSDRFTISTSETKKSFFISVHMPLSYESYIKDAKVKVSLIFAETSKLCRLNLDYSSASSTQVGYAVYGFSMTSDSIRNFCNNGLKPHAGLTSATVTGVSIYVPSSAAQSYSKTYVELLSFHFDSGLDDELSIQKAASDYLFNNLLNPAFDWLGNFIADAFRFVTDNFIVPAIGTVGQIFSDAFNNLKPLFTTLFDNIFLPVLDSILSSINTIVSTAASVFTPIIADIINYFAPYFNQLTDIITNNFLDLVSNLTPLINQFVTAITPSFDSIVTNISKNISNIIKECFIPDNSSEEFQEFVSMKDDVSNKFPVFSQLNSFVSVLFDPTGYSPGSSVEYSNLICTFDSFSTSNKHFAVSRNYNFVSGKTYLISLNVSSPVNVSLVFKLPNGSNYVNYTLTNGNNKKTFSLNKDCTSFQFVCHGNTGHFSVTDICLYSVDSSAGQEFTVNVYGKNVSVLNFDWYMPYKHYGDICVIAFCYLAFIWHTFKKLPTII